MSSRLAEPAGHALAAQAASEPAIVLDHIHQTYASPAGPVTALRDICLRVDSGAIHGVIGRSGAGKSSLVRTINLLNRPASGRVWVGGRELTALDAAAMREARRDIGMVFQHFNLLASRTVAENVALPLELVGWRPALLRRRVAELLDLVGLGPLAGRYPAQISGGQKQRVGIARALASGPRVLLSDEATSALDPETTRAILALLQQVRRELGVTIVLITHQMQVIKQIADCVSVLDEGRLVESGPVIDVFTRPRHATTRSLLDEVLPSALPPGVLARLRQSSQAGENGDTTGSGQARVLLRLAFAGERGDTARLSALVRRFGVDVDLLHGQIDDIQGHPFGLLAVQLRGDSAAVAAARAWLDDSGVLIDEPELAHA